MIDASALVAVMQGEPDTDEILTIIKREDQVVAAAVTVLEAGIVMRARRGPDGLANLMEFIGETGIEIIPFDAGHVAVALEAFGRYAKGMKNRTSLNLGDCASYALATRVNAPLLFKGDD